uniref:DUF4216 domain-containing protein n=1 Tax=Phaseolus vulgaris TaxID=3885 RepID=V7B7Y9_PHAVU|nr:hypothetical protein PHAVU_008G157400g [Phaseolus vulgaris]ESW12978.1 hypothetical protein PHAVU_008G157400g [Phaseolus vulgaris]
MVEVVSAASTFEMSTIERTQAHRYVLFNCPQVQPYIEEFRQHLRRRSRGRRIPNTELEKIVNKDFMNWFPQRINNTDISSTVANDLKYLAQGPTTHARRISAFNVNGFKFRTESREHDLKTQNCGVFLTSSTSCVVSGVDQNIRQANLAYYGKLEDIIELNYYGHFKVILFKCKWADTTRDCGLRKDPWGFTCINFSRLIHTGDREEHDPYIEASQAGMVYYIDDEVNKEWSIAVHLKPRDLYDMGEGDGEVCEVEPCPQQDLHEFFSNSDQLALFREDEDDELLNEDNNDDELHENDSMSE